MRKKVNSSKRIDELKKRRNWLMSELDNIESIENDVNSALWKRLENRCSQDYDIIEDQLANHERLSDVELRSILGERRKIVQLMSVKNCISLKEKWQEELVSIKNKIKEFSDGNEN